MKMTKNYIFTRYEQKYAKILKCRPWMVKESMTTHLFAESIIKACNLFILYLDIIFFYCNIIFLDIGMRLQVLFILVRVYAFNN